MSETKEYPNSGRFFVNDRKRPDKKDPDYNGNGEITCPHCNKKHEGWINIWRKAAAKGDFWGWAWKAKESSGSGSSLGGKSLSSGSQRDMGYSSSMSPRDQERAQAQRRDFGKDVSDDIPF